MMSCLIGAYSEVFTESFVEVRMPFEFGQQSFLPRVDKKNDATVTSV